MNSKRTDREIIQVLQSVYVHIPVKPFNAEATFCPKHNDF